MVHATDFSYVSKWRGEPKHHRSGIFVGTGAIRSLKATLSICRVDAGRMSVTKRLTGPTHNTQGIHFISAIQSTAFTNFRRRRLLISEKALLISEKGVTNLGPYAEGVR